MLHVCYYQAYHMVDQANILDTQMRVFYTALIICHFQDMHVNKGNPLMASPNESSLDVQWKFLYMT